MTQRQRHRRVDRNRHKYKPDSDWDRAPLVIKLGAICQTFLYVLYQLIIKGLILFGLYVVFQMIGNIN